MRRMGFWTDQEDKLLLSLHKQADCFQKWKYISNKMSEKGFSKSELECRQRFVNKLNPDLRHDRLERSEVESLFQYYEQYGPLWSVFETLIPGRTQNILKNKFYSTLRSLVRIIFSLGDDLACDTQKITLTSLSSKLMIDIYEGKRNFRKFKGLLFSMLQKIEFDLEAQKIETLKREINQKTINSLKQEICSSISAKKRASRSTKNETVASATKMKKMEENIIEDQGEHTKPACQEKQVQNVAGKPEETSFGFFMPGVGAFSIFVPQWWGFPLQQIQKSQYFQP